MRYEELEVKEIKLIKEIEEIFNKFKNTKNEKEKTRLAKIHDDKVFELREVQKIMDHWLV